MPNTSAIPIDNWGRRVRVPVGKAAGTIDLDQEIEITIKGKVTSLEAAKPKGENYKGDPGHPAEITIEISSVTFNGKTNTFTKMNRDLDEMDYD